MEDTNDSTLGYAYHCLSSEYPMFAEVMGIINVNNT